METNIRKKYKFNTVKGFIMLFVIFHHIFSLFYENTSIIYEAIKFSINPAFCLIAGYNYKDVSIKNLFKKYSSSYLKPYIYDAIVCLILFPIVHYCFFHWWPGALKEDLKYLFGFLFGIPHSMKVFGLETYEASLVYFFLSLYIGMIVTGCILKIKSKGIRIASLILCFIMAKITGENGISHFCITQGLQCACFCFVGTLIKKYNIFEIIENKVIVYIVLIGVAYLCGKYAEYNMFLGYANNYLFDMTTSMLTAILLILIFIKIDSIKAINNNGLKKIGINTPIIMCAHSIETICFPWYLIFNISDKIVYNFLLLLVLRFVVINIICILIKRIIKIFNHI